ncbi:hypothetical protein L207DRAFT_591204 [Hyaloscypha variabilis F]|uniref:Uncharacterized protein n=1 Tax=Hyaloscypha variabilis (strain UAMH 11265 / GT02V1 / F) TaxID=1149755 RepID=A0A2J6QZT3_HYAVF|nr:hypothetical protein L207DRAFT_591204 [Hyaloscypha variabilis F]
MPTISLLVAQERLQFSLSETILETNLKDRLHLRPSSPTQVTEPTRRNLDTASQRNSRDQPNRRDENLQNEMKQVLSYFPSLNSAGMRNTNSSDKLKAFEACVYFRDFVALFDKCEKHFDFRGIGKATGLQVRDENRIVDKWPLRLKRGTSKREFDIMLAFGHVGSERYVE